MLRRSLRVLNCLFCLVWRHIWLHIWQVTKFGDKFVTKVSDSPIFFLFNTSIYQGKVHSFVTFLLWWTPWQNENSQFYEFDSYLNPMISITKSFLSINISYLLGAIAHLSTTYECQYGQYILLETALPSVPSSFSTFLSLSELFSIKFWWLDKTIMYYDWQKPLLYWFLFWHLARLSGCCVCLFVTMVCLFAMLAPLLYWFLSPCPSLVWSLAAEQTFC